MLDHINRYCTQGGTEKRGKNVTYWDFHHPIVTFRLEGTYMDQDVSTSFMVVKDDEYNSGYCFEDDTIGRNWFYLRDDAQMAPFGVSYCNLYRWTSISVKRGFQGYEISGKHVW